MAWKGQIRFVGMDWLGKVRWLGLARKVGMGRLGPGGHESLAGFGLDRLVGGVRLG